MCFLPIKEQKQQQLCFSFLIHHIDVEGAGRGAIAAEDLKVGDVALEIPMSIVISEELVLESDMVLHLLVWLSSFTPFFTNLSLFNISVKRIK